jgi:hypothetical protein
LLLLVERPDLLARELAQAVVALVDDLEAVHLEDVAVLLVDEQPADGEVERGSRSPDMLRVAAARRASPTVASMLRRSISAWL